MLPGEQKTIELVRRDGLNFRPQPVDGEPVNAREEAAITPFQRGGVTVESTAQLLAARAIGIPDSALDVTFTSSASTVTCNPLSTCYSNSAKWPSLAGNTALTTEITVAATFQFTPAISLWVPGGGKVTFPAVTLGANSEQPIFY